MRLLDWAMDHFAWVVGAFIVLIAGGSLAVLLSYNLTTGTQVCSVESKSVASGETGTDYRIYTTDCGVLEVRDNIFRGKFDSADRFGQIKNGEQYTFDTIGYRLPIFSLFPNVVGISK